MSKSTPCSTCRKTASSLKLISNDERARTNRPLPLLTQHHTHTRTRVRARARAHTHTHTARVFASDSASNTHTHPRAYTHRQTGTIPHARTPTLLSCRVDVVNQLHTGPCCMADDLSTCIRVRVWCVRVMYMCGAPACLSTALAGARFIFFSMALHIASGSCISMRGASSEIGSVRSTRMMEAGRSHMPARGKLGVIRTPPPLPPLLESLLLSRSVPAFVCVRTLSHVSEAYTHHDGMKERALMVGATAATASLSHSHDSL